MQRFALLRCCADVPDAFARKARYAMEMLLLPLGLRPAWISRAELSGHDLYYGPESLSLPVDTFPLSYAPGAARYFTAPGPLDTDHVRWTEFEGERWPMLFPTPSGGDLVASAFFWLSGWQEHTVRDRDQHGRFPHHASLQARWGLTTRPVVDAYREILAGYLVEAGIPIQRRTWNGRSWALCPTCDIDYDRKWRPAAVARAISEVFRWQNGAPINMGKWERLSVLGREWLAGADPYRLALGRMMDETAERGGTGTYFLKAGNTSPYDVPYKLHSAPVRKLIQELGQGTFEVGLHPSYHAHAHPAYLAAEKGTLTREVGTEVSAVRQHYLRFDPALTPRLQANAGFLLDSSLGFSEHEGFRRSTCLPFRLYDVAGDRPLDLWEMPVAAMDATLFNRRGLDVETAEAATRGLMQTARRFGGVCVVIWHNLLWDELDHPGWGAHFLDTLDGARAGGAFIGSLGRAFTAWSAGTHAHV